MKKNILIYKKISNTKKTKRISIVAYANSKIIKHIDTSTKDKSVKKRKLN